MKPAIFSLIVLCMFAAVTPCHAQSLQMFTASGSVVSLDWVGGVVVIRAQNSDEIKIVVPQGTKITKGTEATSLLNINMGDRLTIHFYVDPDTGPTAISITVLI